MNALVPVSMNEMQILAEAVAASKLFGITNASEALSLMAIAQAEGMHPAIAARDYHIIQGRPTLKADAMLARFQLSGGRVVWHQLDDTKADAVFSHPQGGEVRIDWDMKRAKEAGLGGKDMWKKYPRQMLRARVISEGIRTVFPGVLVGMYTPEEVQDFDDKPRASTPQTRIIDVQATEVRQEQKPVVTAATIARQGPQEIKPALDANGKEDWAQWGATFRAILADSSTPEEVDAWSTSNSNVVEALRNSGPKGAKSAENCLSLIATRKEELVSLSAGELPELVSQGASVKTAA